MELAMVQGDVVHIRPATDFDLPHMEALLAIVKARGAARKTEFQTAIAQIEQAMGSLLGGAEQQKQADNQEGNHAN
jgi:hypothetical protein